MAFLAPIGHLLGIASDDAGMRMTDATAVAFIVGWFLRRLPDRHGPGVAAPLIGWWFCALAAASTAGVLWRYGASDDAVANGVRILAGFALTAATVAMFRQQPGLATTLPAVLAASASIAVLAPPIDARARVALFALVSCLAVGMAVQARGRRRMAWAAVSGWLVFGSIAAMIRGPNLSSAFGQTSELIAAARRVLASRPLFGIGMSQDPVTSPLFYSPSFSWNGGAGDTHNLLVVGIELGLLGLALWLAWIGAGLLRAARALAIERRDARLWGAAVGVAVFLAALAVGRPLASSETAFTFQIQFGLMTALAGSTLLNASRAGGQPAPAWLRQGWQRSALATLGASAIVAGALVSAGRGPIEPPDSPDVDGFYEWETSSSGERFRRMQEYASLFVPADVRSVRIPVRATARELRTVTVDIKTDGAAPQSVRLSDEWTDVDVEMLQPPATARLRRIDLRASNAGVDVGEADFVHR